MFAPEGRQRVVASRSGPQDRRRRGRVVVHAVARRVRAVVQPVQPVGVLDDGADRSDAEFAGGFSDDGGFSDEIDAPFAAYRPAASTTTDLPAAPGARSPARAPPASPPHKAPTEPDASPAKPARG